jgi:hypothetical protein
VSVAPFLSGPRSSINSPSTSPLPSTQLAPILSNSDAFCSITFLIASSYLS